MWRRLEFENFKSLREVSIDLEQLTVLVGANGSGKSSVLQGAKILSELTVVPPGHDARVVISRWFGIDAVWSAAKFRTRGVGPDESIKLAALVEPGAFGAPSDAFQVCARPPQVGESPDTVWVEVGHQGQQASLTNPQSGSTQGAAIARELGRLGHGPAIQLSLSARALASPSYLDSETARLTADGYGLPSMLASMAATDRRRLDQLEAALAAIVPRAKGLRMPSAKVTRSEKQFVGHRLEVDIEGTGWLDASLVSDGTLIVLGILALLHSEDCPKLVLIDDLDHSLHPAAHTELLTAIRGLLKTNTSLQILCTTHAPYLLDRFEPREVRVLSVNGHGHTAARKLEDHPDSSEALRGLSTGEFWSTVGEHWATASQED